MNRMRVKTRRVRRNKTVRAQRGGDPKRVGKVLIFYHIYCNKSTHDVVKNQIVNIIFSGLYNRVDAINCFLVGEPACIRSVEELIHGSGKKFQVIAKGVHDKTYERFTLLKIHDLIQPADKLLYIHSKGVSKDKSDNIFWWKTYMEYFLMVKADKCLELLDTYDTVGSKWDHNSHYDGYIVPDHYSGNFWWTRGSYFLTLPRTIGPRYTDPESYITQMKPKHYVLDSHVNKPGPNFYNVAVTPTFYVDI